MVQQPLNLRIYLDDVVSATDSRLECRQLVSCRLTISGPDDPIINQVIRRVGEALPQVRHVVYGTLRQGDRVILLRAPSASFGKDAVRLRKLLAATQLGLVAA